MSRTVPADRVERLVSAAAGAFVDHGFHRTQMDDVAERLGVSKGTVYRSVDSKEALFVAVIDFADQPASAPAEGLLDDRDLEGAARRLRSRLGADISSLRLTAALGRPEPLTDRVEFAAEVESITADLFALLAAHRVGVMVLDRCAPELPELAPGWFGAGRYALVDGWVDYLTGHAPLVTDDVPVEVIGRSITELVTTWAVKMPWDPAPRPLPDDPAAACAAMVRNLVIGAPR